MLKIEVGQFWQRKTGRHYVEITGIEEDKVHFTTRYTDKEPYSGITTRHIATHDLNKYYFLLTDLTRELL